MLLFYVVVSQPNAELTGILPPLRLDLPETAVGKISG
jgi:hypothetical protein